jgi:parvulin-like peptidyl-prolyl isomerase
MMVLRQPLALLFLLSALGCSKPRTGDPVILALGDQVVRRSAFDRHVAELEKRGGNPLGAEVRAALLETFLEERVVVLEARVRGLLGPKATADEEQHAVHQLLSEAGASAAPVGEGEVAEYYRQHASEFKRPETVTVRQVLVTTPNEARDVQRRLLKQPKNFENLARTTSRGPEAPEGGLMGTFARGQLPPELETAAFALPVGGMSEIVETTLGYHVLRVEAREAAHQESLEEAQGRIRALLSRQKSDQRIRQFVSELLAQAKVNHAAADRSPGPS